MPINVVAEQQITVGKEQFVEGPAPEGPYAAVFEDDESTGYFYALDRSGPGQPIRDAMHIYNVDAVTDGHIPSLVEIAWSLDHLKVVLLINDHPHAVFDFATKRGWCRTGFPPPDDHNGWTRHAWDDAALKLFG
jgi:hypothetical protein